MTKINRLAKIVSQYYLNKAAKFVVSADYNEAEQVYIKILKKDPANRKALKEYAKVATLRNDWPAAIERWERVIAAAEAAGKKYPKDAQKKIKQAMLKLSEELYESGRLDEAIVQFEKVTVLDPGNFSALTLLAEIYTKQKNWPKAMECWERVITAAEATGKTYPKGAQKKIKQAMLKLSEELYESGRLDEAIVQFEKVTVLDPGNFSALKKLAEIYAKQKNWLKAIEYWEQVVETSTQVEKELPENKIIDLKYYTNFIETGLLKNKDNNFIEKVQEFWKINYGKEIDPTLNIVFYNLTGQKEPKIIPRRLMWSELIPYFNDMKMRFSYSDKNIYDILFDTPNSVVSVLKRVRGSYYDKNNNSLNSLEAFEILLDNKSDFIIKPSKTDNGIGIRKLTHQNKAIYLDAEKMSLIDLEKQYGANFIVQEIIQQHPIMAAIHPNSVNTLRMVTLRWKNKINYLMSIAKFGTDGNILDNASTGGIWCGINDSGQFLDTAIDKHLMTYSQHPTSKISFGRNQVIPEFDNYKNFVLNLHKNLLHFDLVSWDIAVGKEGQPIFLEANYRGATWLYQLAARRPFFGDITDEVLRHVSGERNKNKHIRSLEGSIE